MIGAAPLARSRPARTIERVRAIAVSRDARIVGTLLLFALLLRLMRLELQGWTPDTYEQLAAANRLTNGDIPLSRLYPPGVALTLAPAVLVGGANLLTMQIVIITASLALIAIAYTRSKIATGDARAAVLLAIALAMAPPFLYFSRDGLFDIIGTTWIVATVMLVPSLKGRGIAAFVAYGIMLSIAINVRATNVALLPALLIYWSDAGGRSIRAAARSCLRPQLVVTAIVMLALSALYAYIGGWLGQASGGAPIILSVFASNFVFNVTSEFGGGVMCVVVLPLAAIGAMHLWRHNRTLLFVAIYFLTIWPVVHAPLHFANGRYMLPPFFFALLLAAHAPSAVFEHAPSLHTRLNMRQRAVVALMLLTAALFGVGDSLIIYTWPHAAGQSDEGAFRTLRPIIASLPDNSLVVGAVDRGVRDSNARIQYLDLIDVSLPHGNTPDTVAAVLRDVEAARAANRPVYYIYSRFEARHDDLGNGGPGYDLYFDAITTARGTTQIASTSVKEFRLYAVQ